MVAELDPLLWLLLLLRGQLGSAGRVPPRPGRRGEGRQGRRRSPRRRIRGRSAVPSRRERQPRRFQRGVLGRLDRQRRLVLEVERELRRRNAPSRRSRQLVPLRSLARCQVGRAAARAEQVAIASTPSGRKSWVITRFASSTRLCAASEQARSASAMSARDSVRASWCSGVGRREWCCSKQRLPRVIVKVFSSLDATMYALLAAATWSTSIAYSTITGLVCKQVRAKCAFPRLSLICRVSFRSTRTCDPATQRDPLAVVWMILRAESPTGSRGEAHVGGKQQPRGGSRRLSASLRNSG